MYYDITMPPSHVGIEQLHDAVMFAYQYLDIPDGTSTEVIFNNKRDPFVGFAMYDFEEQLAEIYIYNKQSAEEILRTLFHEFVHIKQVIDKRLVVFEDSYDRIWNGEHFLHMSEPNELYNDLPWEVEAHSIEQQMIDNFITGVKQNELAT